MKKLENGVRETRSKDNDEDDEIECDTDKNTKIMEGKRYKDMIKKVGKWH
jgi:hypothetical protein